MPEDIGISSGRERGMPALSRSVGSTAEVDAVEFEISPGLDDEECDFVSCTWRSTLWISSSVQSSHGSRLLRSVPVNTVGSWHLHQ